MRKLLRKLLIPTEVLGAVITLSCIVLGMRVGWTTNLVLWTGGGIVLWMCSALLRDLMASLSQIE